jgi:hypothetical protein
MENVTESVVADDQTSSSFGLGNEHDDSGGRKPALQAEEKISPFASTLLVINYISVSYILVPGGKKFLVGSRC